MTSFFTWLQGIVRTIKPWVMVAPWEQGVRVRAGKHVRLLSSGLYLKIPLLDTVSVLPTRMRMAQTPMQTVMTRQRTTISIGLAFRFQVDDVERVFRSLHHPEATLASMCQTHAGEFISTADAADITTANLRTYVRDHVDAAALGFGAFDVFVTDFAAVRTYRLLQEGSWMASDTADALGRNE